ncbi:zinc finger CCCH domain-containing protein 54 [Cornus florida]|uniref:zinc finger CCCH domain-containing protein 54 n=1 Tax=Cornus florida TaxID=4283 RepID=UPI002898CB8A|nr:zinc finger CCCH domain-containing protein 54 [Cornus florida]
MFSFSSQGVFGELPLQGPFTGIFPAQLTGIFDESVYETNDFRMYCYKIKPCSRTRSHDWTLCPFAHNGEKARRRDPRRYNYAAIACPDFKNGECMKGDACPYAHGVFEYWLHPGKYRTRLCNAGKFCQRKVCFFAHSPEELRGETKYKSHYVVRPVPVTNLIGLEGGEGASTSAVGTPPAPVADPPTGGSDWSCEFLSRLRSLKIREEEEERPKDSGWDQSDSDYPDIDWVADLVE